MLTFLYKILNLSSNVDNVGVVQIVSSVYPLALLQSNDAAIEITGIIMIITDKEMAVIFI